MEEMPYLEILCLSDATNKTHQGLTAEGGPQEEENGSATRCPQSCEERGSLITLAWSKPPEDDTDYDTEAANGGTGQNLDSESSLRTQVQPSDMSSTTEYTQCEETSRESFDEELKATGFQSGSTSRHDAQSASEHCSPSQVLCAFMADHKHYITRSHVGFYSPLIFSLVGFGGENGGRSTPEGRRGIWM